MTKRKIVFVFLFNMSFFFIYLCNVKIELLVPLQYDA